MKGIIFYTRKHSSTSTESINNNRFNILLWWKRLHINIIIIIISCLFLRLLDNSRMSNLSLTPKAIKWTCLYDQSMWCYYGLSVTWQRSALLLQSVRKHKVRAVGIEFALVEDTGSGNITNLTLDFTDSLLGHSSNKCYYLTPIK